MKPIDYIREELPRMRTHLKRMSEKEGNVDHCMLIADGLIRMKNMIREHEEVLAILEKQE